MTMPRAVMSASAMSRLQSGADARRGVSRQMRVHLPALGPIGLGAPHLGLYGVGHSGRVEQAERCVQVLQGRPEAL